MVGSMCQSQSTKNTVIILPTKYVKETVANRITYFEMNVYRIDSIMVHVIKGQVELTLICYNL